MVQPWQSPYIGNSSNTGSSGNYGWGGNGNNGGPGSWGGSSYAYHPYNIGGGWSPPVYHAPNPNVINNAMNNANVGSSWAGSSVSASFSTPAGGYSLEGGYILSKDGKKGTQFITRGPSYGLQLSASYNFIYINNMKNIDDFKGKGAVLEINWGMVSFSLFGNTSPNYPENDLFTKYWGFEIGIGPSFGKKSIGGSPSTTTSFVNWIPDISVKEFW